MLDPDHHIHQWEMHDPGLTRKGITQCETLAGDLPPNVPYDPKNCRIVVSPLTRTLQTVQYGLKWLVDLGVPVEVRAEWQVCFTRNMRNLDAG